MIPAARGTANDISLLSEHETPAEPRPCLFDSKRYHGHDQNEIESSSDSHVTENPISPSNCPQSPTSALDASCPPSSSSSRTCCEASSTSSGSESVRFQSTVEVEHVRLAPRLTFYTDTKGRRRVTCRGRQTSSAPTNSRPRQRECQRQEPASIVPMRYSIIPPNILPSASASENDADDEWPVSASSCSADRGEESEDAHDSDGNGCWWRYCNLESRQVNELREDQVNSRCMAFRRTFWQRRSGNSPISPSRSEPHAGMNNRRERTFPTLDGASSEGEVSSSEEEEYFRLMEGGDWRMLWCE
ncbi:hypothetical protein K431DRAFT_327896 [Polychaeton citri CBS 116435]|uniref:Uncharacterized protein n=1 Tax=Polychaeton citri CBS 116435 TaxID=1314669 RepID=A0A9P4Q9K6_9PEZI|nr:hypothetical protein K431DRAFT_327896 [Polychaeton citri CBS 116435]